MGDGSGLVGRTVFAGVVLVVAVLAAGKPPRVVSASPDHADIGVDAGTTEIVVTFDQDMRTGGQSVCGGGPTFPELTGPPVWRNARMVVMPVRLEAGKRYDLSVNCQGGQNFRSVKGEPADVYPISFSTGKPGEVVAVISPEQAKAAAAELWKAIDERYAYRDECGVDWRAAREEFQPALEAAKTPAEFARAVSRLLGETGDIHTHVRVGEFVLPGGKRRVDPNFNGQVIEKVVPGVQKRHHAVVSGRFDDGVGYILISGWGSDPAQEAAMHDALDELADAPGIVIDVRPNSGGDELVARRFAERFVAERAVYSKNRYRDAGPAEGWGPMYERVVGPGPEGKRYRGRAVVLMGPANMSSCESFLLMMRHGARAKLIGEKSWGSSGNPKPVELSCRVTVVLSSWQDFDVDGAMIERKGIAPDVEVKTTAEELRTKDPVIEEGRRQLIQTAAGRR
jgi:hypothetical protein